MSCHGQNLFLITRDESSEEYYDTSYLWELGTFGEHLFLSVCTDESGNSFCVQLWVMKESWTRLVTIPYWSNCLRSICTSKNGEKVLMLETEIFFFFFLEKPVCEQTRAFITTSEGKD